MSEFAARPGTPGQSTGRKLLAASTLMATGTLASRLLGLVRNVLAGDVLSTNRAQADMFAVALSIPTMLYYLFAGGTLNTVLVPQIVRAIKNDEDNGSAYVNRIMTLFGLATLVVTAGAMTLARPVAWLLTDKQWHSPEVAAHFDNIVFLTTLMMPQLFFWGIFFMCGQVLNALDRFGPMMWAPVANNVVQVGLFLFYRQVYGVDGDHTVPFSLNQSYLLAGGTSLGLVAQALILVWFLHRSGFRFRPRFDFRGTGLGHTLNVAKWVLGTVVVAQVATALLNRIATSATADGEGAGLAVYQNAFLLWMMPHGLITVSVTTALLPLVSRLADSGDMVGVRRETMRALRLTATLMVPISFGLAAVALPVCQLLWGYGAGRTGVGATAWTLVAYCVGLPLFTAVYVLTRTFYAMEDTRTTFWLNVGYDLVNVAMAVVLVFPFHRPDWVAPALALAYSLAHIPILPLWFRAVGRHVPGIAMADTVRHWVRVGLASAPAAVGAGAVTGLITRLGDGRVLLAVALGAAALVGVVLFYVGARLLHIEEVAAVVALVTSRLGRRRAAPAASLAGAGTQQAGEPGREDPAGLDTTAAVAADALRDGGGPVAAPSASGAMEEPDNAASAPSGPWLDDGRGPDHLSDTLADHGPVADVGPGQELAGRYCLEEHLVTRGSTMTWRAFDEVLSRAVLIHILAPHDPRTADVLAAARRAAIATDSRFLRVLDAVHSTDSRVGSYIVAEFVPGDSLEALLRQGPLSAVEAGWIVRELADALTTMHAQGLYHERLNLDTVIVSHTGNVKIVGFLTEATLHPQRGDDDLSEADREAHDVEALGRILYALLVARWPGGARYGLAAAPADGDRWLTPRQVRAGVSPVLDQIVDQILSRPPRNREAALRTANNVTMALSRVLGSADAAHDLERRMRQPVLPGSGRSSSAASMNSALTRPSASVPATLAGATSASSAWRTSRGGLPGGVLAGVGATRDEGRRRDDGERLSPVPTPGSQSPASSGASATPASQRAVATPVPRPRAGAHLPPTRSRPRVRPLRLFLAGLLLIALVLGSVALFTRLDQSDAGSTPPAPTVTSAQPTGSQAPREMVSARDFDPEGSRAENPGEVRLAIDRDPATAWHSESYAKPQPATLDGVRKSGVGVIVDLGEAVRVDRVALRLTGEPTGLEIRVADANATEAPLTGVDEWKLVASNQTAGTTPDLTFTSSVTTRWVLVWVTTLPGDPTNGYQAAINEIEVLG